jgi:hypothetical protein
METSSDMRYENYVSCAICKRPTEENPLAGTTEIVLYNPTEKLCQVEMTVYFQDRDPHTFAPIEVVPEHNLQLIMPEMDPAVFEDCGFWGARFLSTTPLVVDVRDGLSYYHEDDSYKGGCTSFLGTKLHKQWLWGNGLWLEWKLYYKGDLSKAPWPFNELEYYYFLNPGPRDAQVAMRLEYQRAGLEPTTFHLTVPAERVYVWCNLHKVLYNQRYTTRVISTKPITTSSVRYIYGLSGFEEWGMNEHMTRPAEPWPITE